MYLVKFSEAVFNTDQNHLAARNGQVVKILGRIVTDPRVEEELGVRYVIQFADGLTTEVFDDRLTETRTMRIVDVDGNETVLALPPLPQWRQALELFDPDAHDSGLDGFDRWLYRWAVQWFVESERCRTLAAEDSVAGEAAIADYFVQRYEEHYGSVDDDGRTDAPLVVEAMELLKDQLDFGAVTGAILRIYNEHRGGNAAE